MKDMKAIIFSIFPSSLWAVKNIDKFRSKLRIFLSKKESAQAFCTLFKMK